MVNLHSGFLTSIHIYSPPSSLNNSLTLLITNHDNKDTLSIHIRFEFLDPVSRNHGILEIMADRAIIKQKCLDEVKAVIDKIMQSLDSDDETDASDEDTTQYQHAETMGTANELHVAAVDELNEGSVVHCSRPQCLLVKFRVWSAPSCIPQEVFLSATRGLPFLPSLR